MITRKLLLTPGKTFEDIASMVAICIVLFFMFFAMLFVASSEPEKSEKTRPAVVYNYLGDDA